MKSVREVTEIFTDLIGVQSYGPGARGGTQNQIRGRKEEMDIKHKKQIPHRSTARRRLQRTWRLQKRSIIR